MSRKVEYRLADIVRCCEKILRFTAGLSRDQLAGDEVLTDAVIRNIEIIGEASKHLPDDVRARMPGIEWKQLAGMRDRITHAYFRVDPDVVWDVVETKVPELLHTLQVFKDANPS